MERDYAWHYGHNIIGGYMTNPSCLSRMNDYTTMPNIMFIWDDGTRESDDYNLIRDEHWWTIESANTVSREANITIDWLMKSEHT
jgi:hypothetical protein